MPDDERLEDELADLKAVHGAAEDLRKEAEEEPYGVSRLRRVKRKSGYPDTTEEEE